MLSSALPYSYTVHCIKYWIFRKVLVMLSMDFSVVLGEWDLLLLPTVVARELTSCTFLVNDKVCCSYRGFSSLE